jgi:hypothetical protein
MFKNKRKKAIDQLRQCQPVDLAAFTPKEAKSILDELEAEVLLHLDKIDKLIAQKQALENSLVSISEAKYKLSLNLP